MEIKNINDRPPNFWGDIDPNKFFLVRCYVCDPEYGRENYLPAVASGYCAWCGAGASGVKANVEKYGDEHGGEK